MASLSILLTLVGQFYACISIVAALAPSSVLYLNGQFAAGIQSESIDCGIALRHISLHCSSSPSSAPSPALSLSLSFLLSLIVCNVSACLLLSLAVPLLFTGNTFIWRGIEALDEASSSEKRRTQSTSHQQQAARQTPQTAPASASEASAQTAAARPSSHRANRPSLSVCGRPPKWCSPLTSFHLSLSPSNHYLSSVLPARALPSTFAV